ncbi:uncharacterized protein FIBRA_05055 [Fibroporia radiculosa]|uniref:Multiple RNA-binding domain-containing protein 1 n=1 Tax=Fibroporia radiculosa TaxID=599839 RepID=J4GQB4_9APHY|nr:uncharacterized protein FIBRA_05055 [Fibroporia radiculosa]CCM02940.1 predicted protein [Fibroporia radiculosa]
MSRLIVKNLPAYLTQERLRSYFDSPDGPGGTLTDVKLVCRPDGTSRRFGFIGYKSPAEAERAKKWFNRAFVDSSRILVEIVEGSKDAPPPRPNKRPRLGPGPDETETRLPNDIRATGQASGILAQKQSKASQSKSHLDEFMQVMQPRTKKGPSWADADVAMPLNRPATNGIDIKDQIDATQSRKSSKAQPTSGENDEMKDATDSLDFESEHRDDGISDMDWFRKRTKAVLDEADPPAEKAFEQSDEEVDDVDRHEATVSEDPPPDPVKETILQTGRLFIRNLAFTCTEDELRELFRNQGEVSNIHIPLDAVTKQPKGLAYVTFARPAQALSAFEALDRTSFQGRLLHILPAVDRKGKVEDEHNGKKTVKGEREAKRKAAAGKEFNWAMLYMNSDAVVSSVADRMNIPKSEILNPESDNAAVKLALAETHIINETKSFLESHGVVLSVFSSSRVQRSDTTILVKNIPYGTSTDTLRTMFGTHGELRRVLVPPAGTLAIIEFEQAADARTAFRSLAYRRLGNTIMYLEKAPMGMFSDVPADSPAMSGQSSKAPVVATAVEPIRAPVSGAALVEGDDAATEPPLSAGTTLFVKNLAFSTTTEGLVHALRHLPGFAFARVQAKVDPARPTARLSMGYGFVGFRTKDDAKRALKSLEGFVLDGHVLAAKWAGRGVDEAEGQEVKGKPKSAKMIVKNVPFEATKKDIQELFGAHAQLKSVRLPRKFNHRTRGFAFLEFVSPHEAARAHATLRHTHFLGRHLVLEWAEDGAADVEELRKKAGVGFGGGKEMPGRKRKLNLGNGGEDEGEDDV